MAESFSFASARSSQSSFGNAQSNHLNYSESNNNNNTVPNGSLQSPLASLARQASLSLSRQGSSASKAVQSPRQPSENDSSYFAPMLAAQDETLVDARSSTYSNQTDPFHYDSYSLSRNVSLADRQTSSGPQAPLAGPGPQRQSSTGRAKAAYSSNNFSRPMRSSQRSPTPSSIAEEHLAPRPESPADTPAFTHHTQTQAESRACADSHASQLSAASAISPAAWTRMADHNENAASSSSEQLQNNYAGGLQSASASNSAPEASTAPHHQRLSLTLPHDPRAFMQRSLSKESINSAQSAASSTYISPTHVEPGPFSSQSYPFQPQQQHPHYHPEQGEPTSAPHDSFPASGVQRDSITPTNFESTPHPAHSQTPEASASRPLRHRHRSSSQTTDNNRLSINRRNSRWKSFFSFRSDKEGEDDDDAYHDDDEHGYLDPESPGAQHVLFRSKADAPGIIFSPPHGQTDHHNIRVPLNQAADVDWEEMHRRRTAEAESAAAMFRSEDFAQLDSNEQGQMHRSRRGVLSHHALVQSRNSTATMLLNTDDAYAADSQRPPSLYSNYSYYEMPASPAPFPRNQQSQSPMPSSSHTRQPPALQLHPAPPPQQRQPQQYDGTTGGTFQKTKRSIDLLAVPGNSRAPRDAESPTASAPRSDEPMDCLLLGIEKHEKGDLDRAAQYFERAASLKGGVGPGMLLWGLSLRHGWGVKADPARGFRWLQRAAESVVGDLDGIVQRGTLSLEEHEQATSAARHELVLSIYELGMCFRQGWGVKKDRKVALMYFELAASLGDADAQQELAFCYLKGKGCKTDKMKAAQFFRMAEAQGVTQWNQAWIHKKKWGGDEKW